MTNIYINQSGNSYFKCCWYVKKVIIQCQSPFEEKTLFYISGLQWITVTLALVGKGGAAAAYVILYVWTGELFPTAMRNIGLGSGSFSASIGAIIAPFIADLVSIACLYGLCVSYITIHQVQENKKGIWLSPVTKFIIPIDNS